MEPNKESDFNLVESLQNSKDVTLSLPAEPVKRGPGRPRKKIKISDEEDSKPKKRTPLNSDMTYLETYKFPAALIGGTINELNQMAEKLNQDINYIRASRTMKSKYTYLANLSGALTGVLASKVSAIRELRGMVTDANNFELKKQNQLKLNDKDSDDKTIMDMYNAFLNAPMGTVGQATPLTVPAQYLNTGGSGTGQSIINANGQPIAINDDAQFKNYIDNLTPQQNAQIQEHNPYIETVVVYNQSTQDRHFEVIDTRTGMPVPNMEVPNQFQLDNLRIDIRKGIARDSQLNQTYKLKLVGTRGADEF